MAHKSTIFKKTCRIITSLIGIADSIFLIFSYSNKYWLTFFGYRHLILSTFFLLFSIGTFITAILALILSKKHFKRLEYYFSLLFAIDFFLVIFILYFSSLKSKEEAYYWISEYSSTHQNQQIMIDFFADYPSNKIESYVRGHTIVVHDVVLLSILIWLVFFILYTFYAHRIMKYLLGKKLLPRKETDLGQGNSELMRDLETEYEYEYSYESNDGNSKPANKADRMKINHVKSADKIFNLVNIDDKVPSQSPLSLKSDDSDSKSIDDNKDSDYIKENDNIADDNKSSHQSPSSLNTSLTQPNKESDISAKPAKKRRRKRSQTRSQSQDDDNNTGRFKDDSIIVSISPANKNMPPPQKKKYDIPKYNWSTNKTPHFGLSSDSAPRKHYPKLKYNWNGPINMHLSSDSPSSSLLDDVENVYSSFILYDSSDSVTFGFDYSDSW